MKLINIIALLGALYGAVAVAKPLTIGNGTKDYLSMGSASGQCSRLNSIAPQTSATAEDADLLSICKSSPTCCVIHLYKGSGCHGAMLASAEVNINDGVELPMFCSADYTLTLSYVFNTINLSEAL